MKWSLSLGKVSGIQVYIHWTFLILVGWIVFQNVASGQTTDQILWSVAFLFAIFLCVFLHELGHALAARRYNIKTRDITMLPIGGLARLESIPEDPKQELVVALAGPAVNLVIASLLWLLVTLDPGSAESFDMMTMDSRSFFYTLMVANLILALFNLIPAFPMDGGRVLRALLSFQMPRPKATRIAASIGQFLAIGFVFIGLFYNPFLLLIGFFIFLGAQAESNFTQTRSLLQGYSVEDVLMTRYRTLEPDDKIEKAVDLLLDGQSTAFLVISDGVVRGSLSRQEMIKALANYGKNARVGDVMRTEIRQLSADEPLEKVYTYFQEHRDALLPVVKQGQLIGVLDKENIHEFIMVQNAMGNAGNGLPYLSRNNGTSKQTTV
ncbi:MAG: site-2 protease family protein [Bacteroidota bacterium]